MHLKTPPPKEETVQPVEPVEPVQPVEPEAFCRAISGTVSAMEPGIGIGIGIPGSEFRDRDRDRNWVGIGIGIGIGIPGSTAPSFISKPPAQPSPHWGRGQRNRAAAPGEEHSPTQPNRAQSSEGALRFPFDARENLQGMNRAHSPVE